VAYLPEADQGLDLRHGCQTVCHAATGSGRG
jgi:hypothetical protein